MIGAARQALAAAFNLAMNGLAGAGVLFGTQTGAVSDLHPTPITPAGWALAAPAWRLSVWSVIFLGVAAFAVWQALPSQRGPRYDAVGALFVTANVLDGPWQVPWLTGQFALAAVVIAGIPASLA